MTSIRGKFASTMTEKNFMFYCDAVGLESLRRAGIIVKSLNPRGSKSNPEGGMVDRIGIGFMRLGKDEAGAETSQPRLRLVPPGHEKALRSLTLMHRPEGAHSAYEFWTSCSVADIGNAANSERKPGLFRLMRRIWKQQPVELIYRDGVEPPQAMMGMVQKFIPVATAEVKRVTGTLKDARGGEKLEQLAESLASETVALPATEPLVAAPRAPEEPPSAPAPEPEVDEASFGYTTLSLLGLRFRVPITEVLRTAETWTRAGYIVNKEASMQ